PLGLTQPRPRPRPRPAVRTAILPPIGLHPTPDLISVDRPGTSPGSAHAVPPSAGSWDLLGVASFLHGTVDLGTSGWRRELDRLVAAELPLTLSAVCSAPGQLAALRDAWPTFGGGTLLVFDRAHGTPRELAAEARHAFAGTPVRIGGGSRAHFAELNRAEDFPADLLDLVAFPIAAQAHHADEASIRETLRVHPLVVRQAAEHGRPVFAGPVGLLPSVGFAAPGDRSPSALFRAAWLVGALSALTGAAAVSLDAAGLADSPAHHVLAALRPFTGGRLADPALPAGLTGLAVRRGGRLLVVAAALDGGEPIVLDARGQGLTTITEADSRTDTPGGSREDSGWIVRERPRGARVSLRPPSIAILVTPPGGDH
ncbi:hypothetical protein, partial [Acrocarpospora sp. B8E8]|uniref:hypothetical protein n=1 Tax=Acrocarpospora sp. B8E8 TaxID=3153572 RepID=UPI00325E82F6